MKRDLETIKEERKMILDMIDKSMELAERLGKHALKSGCNCIDCVNRRKRLIDDRREEWKFEL